MRILLIALCMMMALAPAARAQTAPVPDSDSAPAAAPAAPSALVLNMPDYDPRAYLPLGVEVVDGTLVVSPQVRARSLLFSPEDLDKILNALNRKPPAVAGAGRGKTEIGPDGVVVQGTGDGSEEAKPYYPPIPTKRMISLSGVLYRQPNDWIVWLNGHKLVPGKKLPEVVDIKVERDRVHLKWFDIGMAKIIAITLRPHQTYDIVSGVMLSGPAAAGR